MLHVASDQSGAFSEDDLKLLMIFAGHSASLIKNVRLYGQVMTERNLRENILESSPNSIISLNLRKEISSINRRAEEMFGFKRKEVLGKKAAMVFDQEIAHIIDLALDDHAVVNRKEINPNHGATALGVTSSLLRNHQSALIGAMIIVRDLTEEKKTDELIRRIDRLTSLGQLSAGIAHEIRNPLASIYFNVQLLAKKLPASDPTHSLLGDTQEGVNRIRTLVKGMLDFAKPSPPSLKHDSPDHPRINCPDGGAAAEKQGGGGASFRGRPAGHCLRPSPDPAGVDQSADQRHGRHARRRPHRPGRPVCRRRPLRRGDPELH